MLTQKILTHINTIKPKVNEWAVEAVLLNKDNIVQLLRARQLGKGLDSSGNLMGRYSPNTEGFAERDNITTPKTPGAPFNFYWTGDTMENLYIKSVNKSQQTYNISTIAGKKKLLESIYGRIFDLTEDLNNFVNETMIEPYLVNKIEENLFNI